MEKAQIVRERFQEGRRLFKSVRHIQEVSEGTRAERKKQTTEQTKTLGSQKPGEPNTSPRMEKNITNQGAWRKIKEGGRCIEGGGENYPQGDTKKVTRTYYAVWGTFRGDQGVEKQPIGFPPVSKKIKRKGQNPQPKKKTVVRPGVREGVRIKPWSGGGKP